MIRDKESPNRMSDISCEPAVPLILGLLFLGGLAADLVGRFTFLPRVTLLLIVGMVFGPTGFSLLPESFVTTWFPALTTIALALIGFLLGQQLSITALRERGFQVITISLCKVLGAWLAVGTALWIAGAPLIVAMLLAGIAPATDPAATYDQVHESQLETGFNDTLLAVVAVDDVWGLLIFVAMLAIATIVGAGAVAEANVLSSLMDLVKSIALGSGIGVLMAYLTGRILPGEPTLVEAIGFVLLGAGIAETFSLLPIVTAMAMGVTVASLAKHHERAFHAIEGIEWPFMVLFFVFAGASLRLDALSEVAVLASAYIVSRCLGIYAGTRAGCRIANADSRTRKYLGLALFPQAGVAIGMALLGAQRFPNDAQLILTVAIASTIVLETVGPIFARQAIRAAARA
jgi:Kef-type K+ transport system membrane component KefB